MNIGLLLGSFDPPHIGHVYAAHYGLNHGMDVVWVVPAWKNPWKTNQSPYEHRVTMCKEMFLDFQHSMFIGDHIPEPKIVVSEFDAGVKSNYTYEGLEKLLEMDKKNNFYIIGGTDIARQIPKWKHGDWIIKNFGVIEVPRMGVTNEKTEIGIECSSTAIRKMIQDGISPLPFISFRLLEHIKTYNLYK